MSENPTPPTPDFSPDPNPKAAAKAAKAYAKANRPWFKKKRWWLVGVVVLLVIIGALSDSGSGDPDSAKDASDTPTSAAPKATESAKPAETQAPTTKAPEKPKPKPTWKTVAKLSGSTTKAGPDFHLNGCDARLTYDIKGSSSVVVGIYVLDSDTKLMEDGGVPVAMPTKAGAGETTLRKDEGDYYIDVEAANADWSVQVQEKC